MKNATGILVAGVGLAFAWALAKSKSAGGSSLMSGPEFLSWVQTQTTPIFKVGDTVNVTGQATPDGDPFITVKFVDGADLLIDTLDEGGIRMHDFPITETDFIAGIQELVNNGAQLEMFVQGNSGSGNGGDPGNGGGGTSHPMFAVGDNVVWFGAPDAGASTCWTVTEVGPDYYRFDGNFARTFAYLDDYVNIHGGTVQHCSTGA